MASYAPASSGDPSGALRYVLPAADLSRTLSVYFGLGPTPAAAVETIPALLPNIHVRLAGTTRYEFAGGHVLDAPPVLLIGPTNGAMRLTMSEGTVIVGVGLLAHGWRQLVGASAGDVADRAIDAAALWPASVLARLCQRLAEAACAGTRAAVFEAFLRTRIGEASGADACRADAVETWIERSPSLAIDELSRSLEIGARQVERITLDLCGAAPKLLAMKYRALRSATQLAMRGPQAMDEAVAGFADQAHLIRDFRRFVGATPGAYCRNHAMLARATIEGRLRSGVVRPISIWS